MYLSLAAASWVIIWAKAGLEVEKAGPCPMARQGAAYGRNKINKIPAWGCLWNQKKGLVC